MSLVNTLMIFFIENYFYHITINDMRFNQSLSALTAMFFFPFVPFANSCSPPLCFKIRIIVVSFLFSVTMFMSQILLAELRISGTSAKNTGVNQQLQLLTVFSIFKNFSNYLEWLGDRGTSASPPS